MSQYLYLIINALTFFGPLFGLWLFRKRLTFSFSHYLIAMAIVSLPFLIWDSVATSRLDWWFSKEFTTGIMVGNLPLEEVLFFITTSFACLVLSLAVSAVTKKEVIRIPTAVWWIVSAVALVVAMFLNGRYYTVTVFTALAVTSTYIAFVRAALITTRQFWLYALVVYVMFILVNSVLTGMPVVMYNGASFSEIRLGTIPIEDFVYNFLLLFWYLHLYEILQQKGSYTYK